MRGPLLHAEYLQAHTAVSRLDLAFCAGLLQDVKHEAHWSPQAQDTLAQLGDEDLQRPVHHSFQGW